MPRFESPVGTDGERAAIWPFPWRVINAYANRYILIRDIWAIHTGLDFIADTPGHTAHTGVHAIADGPITFAARIPSSTWGNLIIQQITAPDGRTAYVRYAHVEDMHVKAGDVVIKGTQIAEVGNAFGQFAYHLHFDISLTDVLKRHPADWPGLDMARIQRDYTDPEAFLREGAALPDTLIRAALKAPARVPVYQIASLSSPVVRYLVPGSAVEVDSAAPKIESASGVKFYATPDDCWIPEDCLDLTPVQSSSEVLQVATNYLRLRSGPGTTYSTLRTYDPPAQVTVTDKVVAGTITWRKVVAPQAGWMAQSVGAETYLVPVPPPPPPRIRSGSRIGIHYMPGGNNDWVKAVVADVWNAGKLALPVKIVKMGGGFSNGLQVSDIRSVSPYSTVVLRPYFDDWEGELGRMLEAYPERWETPDLTALGEAYAEKYIQRFILDNPDNALADYHQICCEINYGQGSGTFWIGVMNTFEKHGQRVGCVCSSTYHPPLPSEMENGALRKNDRFWEYKDTLDMVERVMKGKHALFFDQYPFPDLGDLDDNKQQRLPLGKWDDPGGMLRHKAVRALLPDHLKRVTILLVELGTKSANLMSSEQFMANVRAFEAANDDSEGMIWSEGGGGTWLDSQIGRHHDPLRTYWLGLL